MIQDITPYQYKNEYQPTSPDQDSFLLCYDKNYILIKESNEGIVFPTFREMEVLIEKEKLYKDYIYLFQIDNMRFYLGQNINNITPQNYQWKKTQILRKTFPKHLCFAGMIGEQLNRWYQSHHYCGHCQTEMIVSQKERMVYCPKCGLIEYPKICPATIIAVTHGNRLLMSRYVGRDKSHYALIAGYAEVGETIEETVKREVMEEVGLKVKNITYYKSQPWPISDTLLFGFFCELDGDDENIRLDENELEFAQWFDRTDIPVTYDDFSLTNEMIIAFKEKKLK